MDNEESSFCKELIGFVNLCGRINHMLNNIPERDHIKCFSQAHGCIEVSLQDGKSPRARDIDTPL